MVVASFARSHPHCAKAGPGRDATEITSGRRWRSGLAPAAVSRSAIGLNRDLRGKPAGVRTHALLSLGSAAVTLIAADVGVANSDVAAVSRVMQGIITGIGFLGAGVILHPDQGRVRGLTTAASIWVVAALGIACGVADWWPLGLGGGLTLLVLMAGGPLERATHRLVGEPREAADADADGEQKPPTDG